MKYNYILWQNIQTLFSRINKKNKNNFKTLHFNFHSLKTIGVIIFTGENGIVCLLA